MTSHKRSGHAFCFRLRLGLAILLALAERGFSQSNALWSGSAQCTVNEQDQSYQRQEVQTWALTGAAPSQQGAMQIYPATWTDTGAGQLERVQGGQTNDTAWQTNAQGAASIVFFIRASDGRLIIAAKHARQSVYGGISATRQITANGVPQSPTPFNQTVFEWVFPRIEAAADATVVDGSAQSPSEGLPADLLHRFGGSAPLAVCQWHFAKGGMGSANSNPAGMGTTQTSSQQAPPYGSSGNSNSQNCETPATVQQSFETMKAQLQAQYDQLIRGTTDPNEIAALTSQEQQILASLTNQEQRDMTLASQGCLPKNTTVGSTTSPPSGGSQNTGMQGTGGQGTQSQTTPGTSGPGVNLTTSSGGTGTGNVAMMPVGTGCGPNCMQYSPGTAVTVIAVPNTGSTFTTFNGGGCAAANPCSFTITASTNVIAAFSLNSTPTGPAGGTMSRSPLGVGATIPSAVTPVAVTSTSTGSKPTTLPMTGVNLTPPKAVVKATTSSSSAPASSNYLVTLVGLLCTMPTTGGGDAIYPAAFVRQYDRRSGQATMFTSTNTWVYGDINGMQDQRKQAGSRNTTGGIEQGDMIPPGFVPGIKRTLPPQANLLPLNLWQGTLTDGVDVVVISPSVWENYGPNPLFSTWNQNETSFTNSILLDNNAQNQINNQALGVIFLGSSENAPGSVSQAKAENAGSTVYDVATALGGPSSLGGGLIITGIIGALQHPNQDRPIGLADASSTSIVLPNATLILTREIIEKHLGSNGWMTMAIDFKDTSHGISGGDHPGEYTMFLQIERQ